MEEPLAGRQEGLGGGGPPPRPTHRPQLLATGSLPPRAPSMDLQLRSGPNPGASTLGWLGALRQVTSR